MAITNTKHIYKDGKKYQFNWNKRSGDIELIEVLNKLNFYRLNALEIKVFTEVGLNGI